MRWLVVPCVVAACGGTAPTAPPDTPPSLTSAPDPADELRVQLERETALLEDLATRGCACADAICLEAIDDEVAAYLRVAVFGDVMTDVEIWPPDLDARGQAAVDELVSCMDVLQVEPLGFAIIPLRRYQGFRDAACACADALCIQRVVDKVDEDMREYEAYLFSESTEAELDAAVAELTGCVEALVTATHQQAVLELKELRAAACACADAECVDRAQAEYNAYLARYAEIRSDVATADKVGEVAGEILACLEAAIRGE